MMGIWWNHGWGGRGTRVVDRIVAAINARDLSRLRNLLTPDVALIDSMGEEVTGQDSVLLLLERLIAYDPDFRINVEGMTAHKDYVLVAGSISGSQQLSSQRTLWKLLMRDGRMAEWRSYSADNPRPVTRMLMGSQAQVRVEVPAQEAA